MNSITAHFPYIFDSLMREILSDASCLSLARLSDPGCGHDYLS